MSFLSALLLLAELSSTTTTVSINSRSNMVSTYIRSGNPGQPKFVSLVAAATTKTMSGNASDLSVTFGKTESSTAKPPFPSEEPSEIELEKWFEKWTNALRASHLLGEHQLEI